MGRKTSRDKAVEARENQVVRSIRGRDSKRFFVVKSVENDFVYLVDGKLRKLEKPKKKKRKHIALTNSFIELEGISNKKLYKNLTDFNDNDK